MDLTTEAVTQKIGVSVNMELDTCIKSARATRSFSNEPVDRTVIEQLIDYARRAGSGHNRQPWTFIALTDRDRIDALASYGNYTTPLTNAPAGIVIAVDKGDGRRNEHNIFDCGRAAQNLVLGAVEIGLGTVPQGISDREEAAQFLKLPDTKRILMAIALGYPAESPATTIEGVPKFEELHHPSRKPVDEVLHWDTHTE